MELTCGPCYALHRTVGAHMIRTLMLLAAATLALPATAQTPIPTPWSNEIDPAAIYDFDPDGAAGIPLTVGNVRSYLSKPIPALPREAWSALGERTRAAREAKAEILASPDLLTPLWSENAFELQDGTVRPMTARELAVFTELDILEAAVRSSSARQALAAANETERAMLADALVRMLQAHVRFSGWQTDGYRKIDSGWLWLDYEDGQLVDSRPAAVEIENALLRYELARAAMARGAQVRHVIQASQQQ